jgi:hypothetical protein
MMSHHIEMCEQCNSFCVRCSDAENPEEFCSEECERDYENDSFEDEDELDGEDEG